MTRHDRVRRILTNSSLPLILMAGFCVLPVFGAPAPTKEESSAKEKLTAAAYGSCRTGAVDLLGSRKGTAAQSANFLALTDSETMDYLVFHQACEASVSGLTDGCGLLGGPKKQCLDDVVYAAFVSAVFGKGDPLAACEQFIASVVGEGRSKNNNRRNKACDIIIAELKRGSTSLCADLRAAGMLKGRSLAACQHQVYLDGIPDKCRSGSVKIDEFACREKATLLSALRSRDFHDCVNSPWCRALSSRKTEACDPYLTRADKLFCDEQIARARKYPQKPVYQKGAPMTIGGSAEPK